MFTSVTWSSLQKEFTYFRKVLYDKLLEYFIKYSVMKQYSLLKEGSKLLKY